jgi:hypothetical protein
MKKHRLIKDSNDGIGYYFNYEWLNAISRYAI